MKRTERFGAGLALAWYLAIGFALPLFDGALFHDSAAVAAAHVESTDADCHRGECSLRAPGAPCSPAGPPATAARLDALPVVDLPTPVVAEVGSSAPRHTRTARAPPTHLT